MTAFFVSSVDEVLLSGNNRILKSYVCLCFCAQQMVPLYEKSNLLFFSVHIAVKASLGRLEFSKQIYFYLKLHKIFCLGIF